MEWLGHPLITLGSLLTTIAAIWFGTFQQRKKASIDESALIFAEWRKLIDAHQTQIQGLEERFDNYRKTAREEIEGLRKRLKDVEDEFAQFRRDSDRRAREREEKIVGLERQLSQVSKSTAIQLGLVRGVSARDDADAINRLDRAGDNSIPKEGEGK